MTEAATPGGAGVAGALRATVAALVVGATAAAFAISFAAIIYKGPLSPFLAQGIGLTLLGAVVMGAVAAFRYSYRGTICQPQDVTTILLAGAAGSIVAGQTAAGVAQLFPTVVALVACAAILTGAVSWASGRLRLGFLARYIPYPVIGGFLAASGYLLIVGAIGLALGRDVDFWTLPTILVGGDPARWLPWLVAGGAITALTRITGNNLVLPVALVIIVAAFFGYLSLRGLTLADAEAAGLLLGPFPADGLLPRDPGALLSQVRWGPILGQLPTLFAVAGLAVLGSLLNSTGTEMTLDRDVDFARDLRGAGLANAAAGVFGGLPGFQLLGATIFANRLGVTGPLAGLSAALGCGLVLAFGADLLGVIPVGLFAAVIAFLGFDLLYGWLWVERRKLSTTDFTLVVLILLCAAMVGFLPAFAFGVMLAALVFIASYARIDMVRLRSTVAARRSPVERDDADLDYLSEAGQSAVVLELSGYLFFGTANRLTIRVEGEVSAPRIRALVIDFARVYGLDASAVFSLVKIARICRDAGVTVYFTGMSDTIRGQYERTAAGEDIARIVPALSTALERVEDALLEEREAGELAERPDPLLDALDRKSRDDTPGLRAVDVEEGEALIRQGGTSGEIFVLVSGTMHAEIERPSDPPLLIARYLPGALIGEIGYYAGVPRTATIRADSAAAAVAVDPEALARSDPDLSDAFHRFAARHLSRRLIRMTNLVREAGI